MPDLSKLHLSKSHLSKSHLSKSHLSKSHLSKTVLLFYRDYECDRFFKNDRYVKRIIKPLIAPFRTGPKVSGFLVWYRLLVLALKESGCDVRLNDYRTARKNPGFPVGLVGYPAILDDWNLPNPALLGPGLLDHPRIRPHLMEDKRYRGYIVTCDWNRRLFAPTYGNECLINWHAGIDLTQWPDTSQTREKTVDVLVYDKVRWNREKYEPELISPLLQHFADRNLRVEVVRYGAYNHETYRSLLQTARSLVFLCEHETQGMAYQESLAANVPVLAWDQGFWLDPRRPEWEPNPVPATSVPYFGPDCGERFADLPAFYPAWETFWHNVEAGAYQPRRFVARELSVAGSAAQYLSAYRALHDT